MYGSNNNTRLNTPSDMQRWIKTRVPRQSTPKMNNAKKGRANAAKAT